MAEAHALARLPFPAHDLADHGFAVSVVNPAQIKAYAGAMGVRSKTDAVDAKVIAEFCATTNPRLWVALAKSVRGLRALVARREALVDLRTQESNRLEVAATEQVRQSIDSVIAVLDREIQEIERQIREGKVKAVVSKVFPLEDAAEAHAFLEGLSHTGKVMLEV